MSNTRDLMKFGYRELDIAGDLLKAFKDPKLDITQYLGDNVAIEFNPNSGNVFLVDEDCNVAMLNGDKLDDHFYTPHAGHEGFIDELLDLDPDDFYQPDVEYIKDIAEGKGYDLKDYNEWGIL